MTNRVIIVNDPFDPASHEVHVVTSHAAFLASRWKHLPPYMALYHEQILPANNVTPSDAAGVQRFEQLTGDVYAVQYPQELGTAAYLVYALIFVAVIVLSKGIPDVPAVALRNSSPPSANNDLAQRSNKPRPNARIPDIYGEAISIPDVLSRTYSTYVNHEEREHSYYCIGRGEYAVDLVKDDTTLLEQIDGASAGVYGPNTSPNFGAPMLQIGEPINERVVSVARTEAVNGQSLVAPNEDAFTAQLKFLYPNQIIAPTDSGIDFTLLFTAADEVQVYGSFTRQFTAGSARRITEDGSGTIRITADGHLLGLIGQLRAGIEYNNANTAGQFITITMATQTISGQPINVSGIYQIQTDTVAGDFTLRDVDLFNATWALLPGGESVVDVIEVTFAPSMGAISLNGAYVVDSVSEFAVTLLDPGLSVPNWALTYNGGATVPQVPPGSTTAVTMSLNDAPPNWIGPFDVPLNGQTNFVANFIATGGLYKDNGTTQSTLNIDIEIEYTPLTIAGGVAGPTRVYAATVYGSSITKSQRARTVAPLVDLLPTPNARFRARRVTPRDIFFSGQFVDDIQWKDLYVIAPVSALHFGNVTTIQTITIATKGALSVKNRKLNARVCRVLPILQPEASAPYYSFGTPAPTKNFADILAAICLDEKIGARPTSEVNFRNLYDTSEAVAAYFGRESPRRFSYTFDDDNISFEETATSIAEACFCVLYRRGNILNLAFERLNSSASLLFCHRNKLPRSEKRTVNFGIDGNYDGIEYEYVHPIDSAPMTIRLPADGSAIRPKSIKSVGVRSLTQATLQAYRIWNKMRYRRTTVEFTATHEAELLVRNERILVANNVRQGTQDGEVRSMPDSTTIDTSQPVAFESGVDYVAFVQCVDGTVQAIGCTAGANEYQIILDEEPDAAMSVNPANYALATYTVVKAEDGDAGLAFLVAERSYESAFTSKVSAINYDARYYANDQDFAGRIAHYMPDEGTTYDTSTTEQKDTGGYYADGSLTPPTIPATGARAYVYSMGYNED